MKKLLIFALLFLSCKSENAYNYADCGVTIQSPYLTDALVFSPEEQLTIGLKLITSRDLDSFRIFKALDSLNSGFRSAKIQFKLLEIDTFSSEGIQYFVQDALNYKKINRFKEPTIDIFIYKNDFSYYPGIALAIKSDALAIQEAFFGSSTLIHEMGHCLGLYHTHDNSGNGYDKGDYICDTPDTDILMDKVDYNCAYKGELFTSEEVKIIIHNYMSYVNHRCRTQFTKDQIDKMRFHIARESLLRNTLIF